MEKVIIKLKENPDFKDHKDADKIKMLHVGSLWYCVPLDGADGKTITGLDEDAIAIARIEDKGIRENKKKEVKELRLKLEKALALDLGPNSSYWDKFTFVLSDEEITLDPENPRDRLVEAFLIANKYVAPSREAIDENEEFIDCIFYFHRETEEITKAAKKEQANDKAIGKLSNLKDNPDKLIMVFSYLTGAVIGKEITADEAYIKLRQSFNIGSARDKQENIKKFLLAESLTTEELMVKVIVDLAINKKVITSRNNIYRRKGDDKVLGNNLEETLSYLSDPSNSSELRSIQREVGLK